MDHQPQRNEHTVSTRTIELVVAALFMAFALLVMWDSWAMGARWASDGPEAGYFPFYVSLLMLLASVVTFATNLFARSADRSNFVERTQLKAVLQVLIPTAVFVAIIPWFGIYVSGGLFIAYFMYWLGNYGIAKILPVALLVPLALFFMFEVWFLVSLPKGPLEAALGY